MHSSAKRFVAAVEERYGHSPDVHEFSEGTKTAADAAAAVGCDVAQIASSLVFVADDAPVVVVTSGANRVSEDRLAAVAAADEVRMATPDEVKTATGWSIGGVPPFPHATDVPVYVDETLLDHDRVWAAAGTPEGVFPIAPDDLVEHADGEVARVAES